MRRPRREVAVVQVVGLDPRVDEAAHQPVEHLDVVVDPFQEHGLADEQNPLVGEAPAGGARLGRQLARVVGVDGDDDGLLPDGERARHRRRHPLGRGDRQAGVPAKGPDVVDRGDRRRRLGDAARRQGQGIAAGQDRLPDRGPRANVVERGGERLRAEPPRARPDALAAEAEAAIDGADRNELDQHAVGIAMDEPLDRTLGVVADRVVDLGRVAPKLADVGDELARDRVPGVVAVDQADEGGREADGVALGDGLEVREPPGRGEAGFDEGVRRRNAQRRAARRGAARFRSGVARRVTRPQCFQGCHGRGSLGARPQAIKSGGSPGSRSPPDPATE